MRLKEAIAHKDESGKIQLLIDHLNNVASLAASYASEFGCATSGYRAGLFHDIGKCSEAFEKRLSGGPKVDHSSAGAYLMLTERRLAEAIVIAGHHSGLLDMGLDKNSPGTFLARIYKEGLKNFEKLKKDLKYPEDPDDLSCFKDDSLEWFIKIHFLFSALIDADYTDTSRFFNDDIEFKEYDFHQVCEKIEERALLYLNAKSDNPINDIRNSILKECLDKGKLDQGIYTLTIPTGGGKTFSSLAFAARHAKYHKNIRRIIYVIPYLSIIEQNAEVIRSIVGRENVLEHHSVSSIFTDESEENRRVLRASENWNIPIVVTTNEQFFESLFSEKTGKCRKIHNIANSVIIFDEAQMLPLKYLELFCALIECLSRNKNYGITSIFCTATQPSLSRFFKMQQIPELVSKEYSDDPIFRRCRVEVIGKIDEAEKLCNLVTESYSQALIIVNLKKEANEVFEYLPSESRFYLTTNITPFLRKQTLKKIKARLEEGKPCYVVSTSLIEAGVDIDFPVVYREVNGLDSIIQAGGRCNREGKRPVVDSILYIFDFNKMRNYGDFSRKKAAFIEVVNNNKDVFSSSAIESYYQYYYKDSQTGAGMSDFTSISYLAFHEIGEKIKIIDQDDIGIFIRENDDAEIIYNEIMRNGASLSLIRKASEYTIRCPKYIFDMMLKEDLVEVVEDSFFVLKDDTKYDRETGFIFDKNDNSQAIFI